MFAVPIEKLIGRSDLLTGALHHGAGWELAWVSLDSHLVPSREGVPGFLGHTARGRGIRNDHGFAGVAAIGDDALMTKDAKEGHRHHGTRP